jgi:hypothetical protein
MPASSMGSAKSTFFNGNLQICLYLESVYKFTLFVMPDLIRHPETLENTGCAHSLRSLRLPSVARLEFIPMKIGARMTTFYENRSLGTDTI